MSLIVAASFCQRICCLAAEFCACAVASRSNRQKKCFKGPPGKRGHYKSVGLCGVGWTRSSGVFRENSGWRDLSPPKGGFIYGPPGFPRLAPWALVLRRFAASLAVMFIG